MTARHSAENDPGPFHCPVCGHSLRWTGTRNTRRTRAEIRAGIPVQVVRQRRLRAATFDCPVGLAEHRLDARLPPGHAPRTRHAGGEVSWRREHIAPRRTEFLPPGDPARTPWRFAPRPCRPAEGPAVGEPVPSGAAAP